LVAEVENQHKVPVGIDGRPQSYESTGILGSLRATAFSPELAAIIWDRLKDAIPLVRVMDEYTPTDHDGKKVWRAVGINPVMRFIVYPEGEGESKLVPHYDSTFDGFSSGTHRTLMSLVLYLDTSAPGSGGGTQFILDPQRHLPVRERRFQDWDVDPSPSEVLVTVPPTQGAALLFDHRLLHAGEKALGGKVIIRTDIIFVECGVLPRGVRCPLIVEGEGPETFGLTLPASAETVDSAYRAALESVTEEHHAQRMELLWKMLRDPFYSLVYATRGWSAAKFAGFFDDHKSLETLDESGDDPAFLVTPLHKILRRLEESKQRRDGATETKPLAVLFTTGAFCPIQAGHLRSMELAREALEERGYEVLGGFFSPDSDHYVLQKVGPFVTDAIQRVRMCQATVKDSDWLDVDPWNALHTDRARNFTDGVERLSAYLSRHVPTGRPIEVYYVFGGDNAPFAYAFAERGHCVCVERSGYEQLWKKVADDPLVKWNRRLLMVHNPEDTPNHSSTAVRSGDYSALGMETRKLWEQERRSLLSAFEVRPARGILHIRHEDDWPIAHWSSYCDPERLAASWGTFTKGVIGAFAAAFERGRWNVAIQMLSLSTQREQARLATQGHDVISLDPCIPGSINLGVSRVYPVGATVSPLDMIPRPGWPSFDEQLAAIQPGEYILFDDDSATGRTLAWVERLLSTKDLTIIREETLTRGRISIEEPERVRDLCDMRDFIAGAREGGLVVKLPDGSVARAPYSLPYVLPAARISLPLGQERWFSRRIWELNLEFFSSLDSTLTVEHAFPAFKTLALYIGFERSTPMADVAEWHVRRLRPRF
jgi:nicotinic acid mononucleotide adenylyltransferase